jgi:hypothetical protein
MNKLGFGFVSGVVVAIASMSISVQAIAGNRIIQDGYCQLVQIQRRF